MPRLTTIVAPQQRAVTQPGEEAAVSARERVDVRVERALYLLPVTVGAPPVHGRVRAAAAVRLERSRRGGDEPELGVVGVHGERPGVAALATRVGRVPRHAAVAAPGCAVATGLLRAAGHGR